MQKRHFKLIIIAIALLAATPAAAQKRRAAARQPAVPVLEQARQALANYDFERAEELLDKEVTTLRKRRQPTAEAEALLHAAQRGLTKLHATERIVIIDSLVCSKAEALRAIRLSHESGRIDTYASTYHAQDTLGATIYENELANKRFLAIPASGSTLQLAFSDKIGDSWSDPTPLSGLNDDDLSQNFPFLLSDGITLYYAARGPESFGGYDIFVSRADDEEGQFLTPENVGFPYNSPANDYLLAIDELNQLGWFVTDRRQPEGMVCIYTFIPNDTRQTFGDETSDAQLQAFARITSIRDTWTDATAVSAAQERLAAVRAGSSAATPTKAPDFLFVINDTRTYTSLDDFRSAAAREKMQQWLLLTKTIDTDATMLQRLRDNYISAKGADRQQIRATILRMEGSHDIQRQEAEALAKEIRNLENSHQ